MAKWANDSVMDAALDIVAAGTILTVCSAQPTTRTEAVTTYKLADVVVDSGDFTKANGDISGRKLTVSAQSNVAVDTTGTATHVAVSNGTVLLYVTTCTSQLLTSGNTVTVPAWDIEISDPSQKGQHMAGNMKDFATGTVATAPSPATSGTSLVLQTGEGVRMPATPFYATGHSPTAVPTLDTAEKIQVTNVTGDTLTIVRAQGGTVAKSIEAGWRISNTLFKEQLDDKEFVAQLHPLSVSTATAAATAAKVGTTAGGTYTPILGDIIVVTFTTANTATSPTLNIDGSGAKSVLLGGVNPTGVAMAGTKAMMYYDGTAWQLFGSQRVSDTDTNTTYIEVTAFTTVTTTTQAASVNNGYITNNVAQVNVTLPATAAIGQIVHVVGLGAGGWRVTAAAGDDIMINGNSTGAAGYIYGSQYATVGMRCIVASTTWEVIDYTGVITTGTGYNTLSGIVKSTTTDKVTTGTTAPSSPTSGDVWFDTNSLPEALAPSSIVWKENPSGTKNGSNTAFTTAQAYISGSLNVFVNGLAEGFSVTESAPGSGGFTLSPAPLSTDNLSVQYQVRTTATGNADTVDGYHANATPTANNISVLNANGKHPSAVIDWSTFSNNIKVAINTNAAAPVNGTALNLASVGSVVSFTVGEACKALVTSTIGCSSTSDFETKPQIWLDGALSSSATYTAAAANASGRIDTRTWQGVVTLSAGAHTISAGIVVSSATSANVAAGNAQISAIVLGNVTA